MPIIVPKAEEAMQWLTEKQREYLSDLRDMSRLINLDIDNKFVREHGDDFTTKLILETYYWRNRLNFGPAVEFKISLKSKQKIPESHLETLDDLFYENLRRVARSAL